VLKRKVPQQPAYAVIGKTRTLIWEHGLDSKERPHVIYDPRSKPHLSSTSGPKATSNYDTRTQASSSQAKFGLVAGWLKPGLDEGYCYQIYQHLQNFDLIYLVGGGLWRWSGINAFLHYVEENHEEFPRKVIPLKIFRLTDFPEKKLKRIFKNLTETI
jgi:hypothetical protein